MAKHTDPISTPPAWIDELAHLADRWQGGDGVSQDEIEENLARWRQRLRRPAMPDEEQLDIVDVQGDLLGLVAPRWFAHLTGLRHRVVHTLLTTPQGMLVLQMRSHSKSDSPGKFSTTVAGHIKAGQSWQTGLFAEIYEEIGLAPEEKERWLAEPGLHEVGGPFEKVGRSARLASSGALWPVIDRQVNRIFTGVITAWGLMHIRFIDGEVDGVYLTTAQETGRLVDSRDRFVAPGLLNVFPRWRAWQRSG